MKQVGIEKLNIYAGVASIGVAELLEGRGLEVERIDNIQQERRSVGLGFEDPVTNAVNAAKPIIDAIGEAADHIEMLIVSSESGIDYSKSISSYVHKHLNLSSQCRFLEVKQACYAATGALQMALGYLYSGLSPGAKVLIIATDITLVDQRAEYAEPSTGFGAAALLLGEEAEILQVDKGAFGLHSYEIMDSARPTPLADTVDVDKSLFAFLDCYTNSFNHYKSRVEGVDFLNSFGGLAMHTPFAGLVKAAHRKIMREQHKNMDAMAIEEDFKHRLGPSLEYPKLVGNLCSGSLYLALASMIDNRKDNQAMRVGLFSYGSGCSSEFYSGIINGTSRSSLKQFDIATHLERRTNLNFSHYVELLEDNLQAINPVENREIELSPYEAYIPSERPPLLALRKITDYYRHYEWI